MEKRSCSTETRLIGMLRDYGLTIASAESLTGGLVAARLVAVPGASYAFYEGFVTYALTAKEHTLGVPCSLLKTRGAISAETAEAMAMGAASKAGTSMAVSTTGNAGPDASEDKPVGLVYIGICIEGGVSSYEYHFSGTRDEIRNEAAKTAVSLCVETLAAYLREHNQAVF